MRERPRIFLILFTVSTTLISNIWASSFPCGPSFVPCTQKRAFSAVLHSPRSDNFSPNSIDNHLKDELKKSMKKEIVEIAAIEAINITEKLFNETEKHMADELSDTSFKSSELAWLQYTYADQYAKYLSFAALSANVAAQKLIEKIPKKMKKAIEFLPTDQTKMKDVCPISQIEECIIGKYRSYTGLCNNIKNPRNGASYEKLQRFLPADYADSISAPRVAKSGNELPSASELSALFTPAPNGHSTCSLLISPFLSFLYDDMVHVPTNRIFKSKSLFSCL
ncbi:unnamed protein product [Caenorhabditis angaria]|uniref:Secreted protein n=1 Tax=Caenorhabditis angaria TaxID=860376 RepID=A0A9P1IQB0_9PELO|nr:unnamed protein product [Caenorhabditis angaria]